MARCFVALGGNLGDVGQTFHEALRRLGSAPNCELRGTSRLFQTIAVGDKADPDFLNAAAELNTELQPLELLDLLQSIERDLGRVRETHWGARTLDLDLLFYDAEIIRSPRLTVPHPAAWYRRFVLDPLVEIAPDLVHPEREADIATLRERLLPRPLVVALAGGKREQRELLMARLGPLFREVQFADRHEPAPGILFWLGPSNDARGQPVDFNALPRLPRLDVSATSIPVEDFIRHVLQSALGTPLPSGERPASAGW